MINNISDAAFINVRRWMGLMANYQSVLLFVKKIST